MRIVVTGKEGQVARSLVERSSGTRFDVVPLGRPELDLAGPAGGIHSAIERANPDLIVSAAAHTQVDRAESEPLLAFAINRDGPRAISIVARTLAIPLIHLSTDYVFDGSKPSPYFEDDATGPTGIYGASKLEGEQAVLAECENSVILRTAWVYSPFGSNFVKTMMRLASERSEISVVADQLGNPTSALDIADGILAVAANLVEDASAALRGVFHMTAAGAATWAEFAEAIFASSAKAGGRSATVKRVSSADYPTAARRPSNSTLDSSKIDRVHGVRLPDWHASLNEVVAHLVQHGNKRSLSE